MEHKMLKDNVFAYSLLIDGKWVKAKKLQEVHSPIDSKVIGYVPTATKDECDKAVDAANRAKRVMANMPAIDRAKILKELSRLLMENKEKLGRLITQESGKPIAMAMDEVVRTAESIEYVAEEAKRITGEVLKSDSFANMPKKMAIVVRQPVGVVLAISPFNYPINLAAAKVAPALAAGNAVILKPASADPMSVYEFAMLAQKAGVPDGALNVLSGNGAEVGDYLVSHAGIDMISFTGSTATGERLAKVAGLKKLHMELGGKSPAIILDDADIELAAKECVKGAFRFSGQRCDAVSRILVVKSIAPSFIKRLVEEAKKWKLGEPEDTTIQCGPLISEDAAKHVDELVKDAKKRGAKILVGGERLKGGYYKPTVIDNATPAMKIAQEEIFGPVAVIIRVKDYEEAIEVANASKYGLHASVFTNDINKAIDAGLRLEDGGVQINAAPARGPDNFPFGGDKASGLGREGIKYTIEEMTKPHSIVINMK